MIFGQTIRKVARRFGFQVRRVPRSDSSAMEQINVTATYAPWKLDSHFMSLYEAIHPHTFLSLYHGWVLWGLVEQVSKFEGAILEVGVWKGGSGALIASRARQVGITDPVYLCDTFRGIVKATSGDLYYANGSLAMSRESVDQFIRQFALEHVQVLEGIFPDETGALVRQDKIRLCHIDVDVYQSARDIFEWVWDRMVVGGVVVFDDYGSVNTIGVIRLVEELHMRPDLAFIHCISGQAVFVKTAQL